MKPDVYAVEGVGDASGKYVTFADPDSDFGKAWDEAGRSHDRLFSDEKIEQEIDGRIEELKNEVEDIENKVINSDYSLSAEDGNTLRKFKSNRIEELKDLKFEIVDKDDETIEGDSVSE